MRFRSFPHRALFVLVSLGLLASCGDDSEPFAVDIDLDAVAGTVQEDITYTVPGTGEVRTLPVWIWYPTTDTSGELTRFSLIFSDANSFVDATLDTPSAPLPVVVWSHGYRGSGGQANIVYRQLVRNGWIVVGFDHTGNTLLDDSLGPNAEFDAVRGHDVNAVIDHIANLPADHLLAGHLRTDQILLAGHSYGGQTAWFAGGAELDLAAVEAGCPTCTQGQLDAFRMYTPDPRIAAVAPLAGRVEDDRVADSGFASTLPILMMTGSEDWDGEPYFTRASTNGANVTWVELQGGCHESFTNTVPCTTLPNEDAVPAVATMLLAFGEVQIQGSTDANALGVLDGTVTVADFLTFSFSP